MEQIAVERSKTRFIYLIKDNNIGFYLVIPNSNKVNIVLNIIENATDEKVKSLNNVSDKVLLIPILNSNIISYLKSDSPNYTQSDNYFSNLISNSYNILKYNNITVDQKVYLNNNIAFNKFNNYFVNKFNGRVELINLQLENQQNEIPPFVQTKVETPIGLDSIYNEDISINQKKEEQTLPHEPGFVSYVLLGVFVAVISLVFLYMIL